jgi:hypothetical protein
MGSSRKQMLGVSAVLSIIALAVSIVLSMLTDGGLGWVGTAVFLLALAALVFVMRSVRSGSGMLGIGSSQEVYIEALARASSEQGLSNYKPGTYEPVWLLGMIPPLLTLAVVLIFFG